MGPDIDGTVCIFLVGGALVCCMRCALCETAIILGIQLRLDGDLCALHPPDLLLDFVPENSKVRLGEGKLLVFRRIDFHREPPSSMLP